MRCLPPTWQINTLDGREHETESLNVSSTRTVNLYARAYDKYTHTHTQNPNLWLGHFCICVFAVNSVASDSQICRIYYIVGFFLALSHFESRRLIFFISFSVCAVLSASPFSGTYHLFQRCNVHISTQTVQWK